MNYYKADIVLQEVPNEISLCFSICGCTLRCQGCHSPFLWKTENGKPLREADYKLYLSKYHGLISCVLFMGGEWEHVNLLNFLKIARKRNLKTCLYTGLDDVSEALKSELTWLKTGAWNPELGGLNNISSNQKFIEVSTKKNLNHLFIPRHHDQINKQPNQ